MRTKTLSANQRVVIGVRSYVGDARHAASHKPDGNAMTYVRPMGVPVAPILEDTRRHCANELSTPDCDNGLIGGPSDPVASAIIAVWYALGLAVWAVVIGWMVR